VEVRVAPTAAGDPLGEYWTQERKEMERRRGRGRREEERGEGRGRRRRREERDEMLVSIYSFFLLSSF
jgi:hypothetical protein